MNEQEWLDCSSPTRMLDFAGGKGTTRKLRWFASACCRRIWTNLSDQGAQKAVALAEQHADGIVGVVDLEALLPLPGEARGHAVAAAYSSCAPAAPACPVCGKGMRLREGLRGYVYGCSVYPRCRGVIPYRHDLRWVEGGCPTLQAVAEKAAHALRTEADFENYYAESQAQCALLHELLGNPFLPVTLEEVWRSPPVPSLAQAAYDERHLPSGHLETVRLAILADALEEAGCPEEPILSHLRSPGPHVRGCWALDHVLERA